MAVRIGHAPIDENGRASGGTAGDQTGKEVCTIDWYANGWNVLLRPVRADLAEKSAAAMEAACRNELIGYDQYGRNTLFHKANEAGFDLAKISAPCECDCSSLVHVCAIAGGAKLTYGSNGYTTRTMVAAFVASGDYIKLTGSEHLTSDKLLKRGDILVKEGSHTIMVLGNGTGAPADYVQEGAATVYYSVRLPMLTKGMKGDTVKVMQYLLLAKGYKLPKFGADGDYGAETENALLLFQEDMNIKPDAKCGAVTWSALLGLPGVG